MRTHILALCSLLFVACGTPEVEESVTQISSACTKQVDPMFACKRDADCVAVSEGGCCPHGTKAAVNKDYTDEYADTHTCDKQLMVCPLYIINDDRQAECETASGTCQMVKIEDIRCNGFTLNQHQCPDGYQCQLDGHIADIPGRCVAAKID
jgi:hypothetical protein